MCYWSQGLKDGGVRWGVGNLSRGAGQCHGRGLAAMWGPERRQADQGGSVASVWWEAAGARDGFIDGNLKDDWPW